MTDTIPALPPDDGDGQPREHFATVRPLPTFTMSLGPVNTNSVCKVLCPSGRRAILPHSCDQRYGREEYASDVSDTDTECEITVKRVGCLL